MALAIPITPCGGGQPTSRHRGFGGYGESPPPTNFAPRKNPAVGRGFLCDVLLVVYTHFEFIFKVCEASIDARFCAINAFL